MRQSLDLDAKRSCNGESRTKNAIITIIKILKPAIKMQEKLKKGLINPSCDL